MQRWGEVLLIMNECPSKQPEWKAAWRVSFSPQRGEGLRVRGAGATKKARPSRGVRSPSPQPSPASGRGSLNAAGTRNHSPP